MSRVLFDTNIFIYGAKSQVDTASFAGLDVHFASVSRVEALGYHNITAAELNTLQHIFDSYQQVDLTEDIIEMAITLRWRRKMGLGDAIVAATALRSGLTLWTANTRDFRHIEGLKLVNPLD